MDNLDSVSDKLKEEAERLLESVHKSMSHTLEFVDGADNVTSLREDFILREAYLTSLENQNDKYEEYKTYLWRKDYLLFLKVREILGQHPQFCYYHEDKKIKDVAKVYKEILNKKKNDLFFSMPKYPNYKPSLELIVKILDDDVIRQKYFNVFYIDEDLSFEIFDFLEKYRNHQEVLKLSNSIKEFNI